MLERRNRIWLLLVCLAAAAPAQTPEETELVEAMRAPWSRFEAGDHAAAIAEMEALSRTHAGAAIVFSTLALFRNVAGDVDGAAAAASRALEIDPKQPSAWLERGYAHFRRGSYADALRDLDRAVELGPQIARAWGVRGDVKRTTGAYAAAIDDYTEALRAQPEFLPAYVNRGQCRGHLGDFVGAARDYRRAMRQAPAMRTLVVDLAEVEELAGRRDEAIATLSRLLADHPDDTEALQRRATLQFERGDFEAAERDLAAVLRRAEDPAAIASAHQQLGIECFLRGDKERALRELAAAAEAAASMAPWAKLMQWATLVLDEREAAIAALPAAEPAEPLLRTLVALCRDGHGDSAALPLPDWRLLDACTVLFFSALRAESEGRREEAAWKLLRCVNTGESQSLQWRCAVELLRRWREDGMPVGYGCTLRATDERGQLVVAAVDPLGAAASQGLQVGDVVTKINNRPATDRHFEELPGNTRVGLSVHLTLRRGGQEGGFWLRSGLLPTDAERTFTPPDAAPLTVPAATEEFVATTPAGWRAEAVMNPAQRSRMLNHRVGEQSEAYVGRIGGEFAGILDTWRRMFDLPPLDDAGRAALPRVPFLGQQAVLLELRGDYRGLDRELPGARLLVVLASGDDGLVFARCLGPDGEVEAQREAFLGFCASVRRAP